MNLSPTSGLPSTKRKVPRAPTTERASAAVRDLSSSPPRRHPATSSSMRSTNRSSAGSLPRRK